VDKKRGETNKPRPKIAIIGKAPSSKDLAPYDDDSWEIWPISDSHVDMPRWDVWHELHDPDYHKENSPHHWEWLIDKDARKGRPLYLLREDARFPGSKPFPKDAVMGLFWKLLNDDAFCYWTNSISWIVGHALLHEPDTIGLWGVDMAQNTEYSGQRPSVEAILGFAMGRGTKVIIPKESDIFKSYRLYGFDTHNGEAYVQLRTRSKELKERVNLCEAQANEAEKAVQRLSGALGELKAIAALNGNAEEYFKTRLEKIKEEMTQMSTFRDSSAHTKLILQGALQNQDWVSSIFLHGN